MDRIPAQLRAQWMPFRTSEILYCLTVADHLETVLREGLMPKIDYFEGLQAVVLAYSRDPLYKPVHEFSIEGFQRKGMQVVRLHICTGNQLYRSLYPNRTYQVISLDPITPSDIVKIEKF